LVQGPALYASLIQHATIAKLAAQLTAAVTEQMATPRPLTRPDLTYDQALLVIGQLMRQIPVLWILDDLGQEPGHPSQASEQAPGGRQELLTLLRSARNTKAKLLLISRDDQQAWLGDLPARLHLSPLPIQERNQLVRAVATEQQVQLTDVGASSPVLRALGGNPKSSSNSPKRRFAPDARQAPNLRHTWRRQQCKECAHCQ
jgi:hypothetical protein